MIYCQAIHSKKINNGGCSMQMTVKLSSSNDIIDTINGIPVIALASDVQCIGQFENIDSPELSIEDLETSQKITVHCKPSDEPETMFLLHPSMVDATGEVTCLPVTKIQLKTGENRTVEFSLYNKIMDKCFSLGVYEVSLGYDSLRSKPCRFIISFQKQSVLELLSIVENTSIDEWVRNKSLQWLQKINSDFDYNFTNPRDNEQRIVSMKKWWDDNSEKPIVEEKLFQINSSAGICR
jgi:hypothetical protein